MKKVILGVLALTIVGVSCKKGDEDPALSLLSRKARLTGEWKKFEENKTGENNHFTLQTTYENDVETLTRIDNFNDTIITTSTYTTNEFVINKDGTFSWVSDRDVISRNGNGNQYSINTFSQYSLIEGKWAFMNKTKGSYKNKERVTFSYMYDSTHTSNFELNEYTYGDPNPYYTDSFVEDYSVYTSLENDNTMIVELLRLSNKEMKWNIEGEYQSMGSGFSPYISTVSGTSVWKKD